MPKTSQIKRNLFQFHVALHLLDVLLHGLLSLCLNKLPYNILQCDQFQNTIQDAPGLFHRNLLLVDHFDPLSLPLLLDVQLVLQLLVACAVRAFYTIAKCSCSPAAPTSHFPCVRPASGPLCGPFPSAPETTCPQQSNPERICTLRGLDFEELLSTLLKAVEDWQTASILPKTAELCLVDLGHVEPFLQHPQLFGAVADSSTIHTWQNRR